jgi:hypothetical protein
MKKTGIIFSTIFLFYACSKNQYKNDSKAYDNSTNKNLTDFLNITKDTTEGYLSIKYKLSRINKEEDIIKLRYFDYDDNIFPLNGVGVINGKTFKLEKHTIINDSILFLPVIANNNSLSVNILNLKTKELLATDIRTFLSFVWINSSNKKIKFIVSDNPKIIDGNENKEMFEYHLKIYEIRNGELQYIRKEILNLTDEIGNNINEEFKIIHSIFEK